MLITSAAASILGATAFADRIKADASEEDMKTLIALLEKASGKLDIASGLFNADYL